MSLLKKASIITTPTAYAEDYLYSIKPAYALGSELVTNGDFSNGTNNWTPNANATLSVENGRLKVAISGAGSGYPSQDITTEVGKKYRITANAFIGTSTKVSLYSVVFGFNDLLVDGSYDLTFKATSTTTQIRLYVYGDGTYGFWDNVSVKEVTDADFDFDRNSTGTRVNEDYLIEDVPYNLASYSENIGQWVNVRTTDSLSTISSPQNTTNVYKIIPTTDNNNHRIDQVITLDNNNTYTLSFFAKKGEYNCIQAAIGKTEVTGNFVSFNLNTGVKTETGTVASSTMNLLPNGWYRCSLTTTAGATDRVVIAIGNDDTYSFAGDASSGLYLWGVQLVKGDQPKDYLKTTDRLDIPRIDYTNGEPSIKLEPSRTNKLPYSQDFTDSGWLKSGSTISTGFLSPEGINNASKLTATNTDPYLLYSVSGITDLIYAASIYIKGTSTSIGKTARLWIIRDNVVFHSEDFTITNIWQRISTTKTFTTTPTSFVSFRVDLPNTDVAVGNETLIYGAQLEVGSYATSLIHTSGSAVTRSADAANNAGNSDLINSTEGVVYAEIKALADDGTFREITINDGTQNDVIEFRYNNVDNQIQFVVRDGGSVTVNSQVAFSNVLEYNKIAFQYKANDFKVFANGRLVATDTTGTVPSGLNQLDFSWAGSSNFYGNAKMVAVFKEALTDLELEKLTGYNNHELYMNYYNRLSYLGLVEEYNVESDINNYIL